MPSSSLSKLQPAIVQAAPPPRPVSAARRSRARRRRAPRAPRRPSRARLAAARRRTPAVVFMIAMLAGLAGASRPLSIGAGLLVTRVIEHAWGIGAADERVNVWLAAHRTPGRTHASLIGSIAAGGVVLPILVGVVALGLRGPAEMADRGLRRLCPRRRSRRPTGSRPSSSTSHRPRVVRLEHLPVNASYPSGSHGGVGRGLRRAGAPASRPGSRAPRYGCSSGRSPSRWSCSWRLSRMYRGMHHPLDVGGGLLVGIGSVGRARLRVPRCRAQSTTAAHGGEA